MKFKGDSALIKTWQGKSLAHLKKDELTHPSEELLVDRRNLICGHTIKKVENNKKE